MIKELLLLLLFPSPSLLLVQRKPGPKCAAEKGRGDDFGQRSLRGATTQLLSLPGKLQTARKASSDHLPNYNQSPAGHSQSQHARSFSPPLVSIMVCAARDARQGGGARILLADVAFARLSALSSVEVLEV